MNPILKALIFKEFKQIVRDPSTIIIAFLLPFILLLIYMYGIQLDTVRVSLGIKNDDNTPETQTLVKSFGHSKYVNSTIYDDRNEMYEDIVRGKLRGAITIPNDFSKKLSKGETADILVIADGSETNLANYVQSYASAISANWLNYASKYKYKVEVPVVSTDIRYWFNQEIDSHHFILPGSLAVTMTLIGILLTALVVAREWERGTMEAILTTKATKMDIVLGKYIPYFILGMCSMMFSVFMIVTVFQIPFRGSYLILFAVAGLFLISSLGFGLLISTVLKNQFLASQAALSVGFLPSLMLSGLVFPISSMPLWIQWISYFIPASYFVSFITSEFLAGTVMIVFLANSLYLSLLGAILFFAVYHKTQMRLDQ